MASEILGLFTTPEQYNAMQQQAQQNRALQFAQLNPFERANYGIYQGAQQLGQGLGSLFGMQDPQLQKITMRQQMLTGAGGGPRIDLNDPQSMIRAAGVAQERNDPEFAQYLINASNELSKSLAETRAKTATAARTELNIAQEESLRKELAALGANPTNEQVLAVVSKYGPAEKILGVLQVAQTAEANRQARKEEVQLKIDEKRDLEKERIQAKVDADALAAERKREAALESAKNQRERDAANNQFKLDLEKSRQDFRQSMAELTQASKPLPAGIQKAEDADYDAAQAAINLANDANKYLTSIKSGNIKFGLKDKMSIAARSAMGSNDPDVVARNDFERFKTTLVNESLRLNKGTQTEGDAIRAAKELQSAESAADAGKAIQTLRDLNARRAADYKSAIERRRANAKLPMPEMIFELPKFEPHVFTNADYAALPKGTVFIDPQGVRRKKP